MVHFGRCMFKNSDCDTSRRAVFQTAQVEQAKAEAGGWRAVPDSISPQGPRSSSIKKDDMDAILERVPSGLRKRFGF